MTERRAAVPSRYVQSGELQGEEGSSATRVVIVHDFLETYGGAERVTQEIARMYPDAPVVAILARPSVARRMEIEDRLQTVLPSSEPLFSHYRLLTPLIPALVDRFRLPDADLLISSSYAFAHRFRLPNGGAHLCYCHSPLRFAWTMTDSYSKTLAAHGVSGMAFRLMAGAMRRTDRRSSRGVNRYVTSSSYVAEQVARFYGQRAEVIGAPVDCELFHPSDGPPNGYFLMCGRLVEPYKRASVAIEAFRGLPKRLLVAGDGPAYTSLKSIAPKNVEFVGHLEDRALVELMQGCSAAVFPSLDDFGLTPLEVMACGRPVLAFAGGGALQTVVPGVTGELFPEQSPEALRDAILHFRQDEYEPAKVRAHVRQWDRQNFERKLKDAAARTVNADRQR